MAQNPYEEAASLVHAVFQGVLQREPNGTELDHWTEALMNGFPPSEFVTTAVSCEEFNPIKLFRPPYHFYSPIVNPDEAAHHYAVLSDRGIPESIPGINLDRAKMTRTWRDLLPFLEKIPFNENISEDFQYAFQNPNYSWGDGGILHSMILYHQPKRIIEIGCGWSSVCILDTLRKYFDHKCKATFIEPYPALLTNLICDVSAPVHIVHSSVQNVSLNIFDELEAGDILFIDSTHVLKTGSDVCFELFEVLPRIAPGVLVHIHDIFWPFEYPRDWAVDENRSWNEVYAVRAYLTNNLDWEIVFFNDFFAKFEKDLIESTWPSFLRNSGGALWLRRA